jgi:hypothetical protein
MKIPAWLKDGVGLAILIGSTVAAVVSWQTQRQIAEAVNTEKVLAHLQTLDLATAADKAWRDQHDVTTGPIIQEHNHFFRTELPEMWKEVRTVFRYVMRHATPQELAPMAMTEPCPPRHEGRTDFREGMWAAETEKEKPK